MCLTIDSDEVDRLAQQLAALLRVDKTEAVRIALVNELQVYEASSANRAMKPDSEPEADSGSAHP